jgi:hypothetical protein
MIPHLTTRLLCGQHQTRQIPTPTVTRTVVWTGGDNNYLTVID